MIYIFVINFQHKAECLKEHKKNFIQFGFIFPTINLVKGIYENEYWALG